MRHRAIGAALLAWGCSCHAQTSPAAPGLPQPPYTLSGEPSLDEYLLALEQIAPAARDGAQAYLQAFSGRCGRALDVMQLRSMVANGTGDPLLMQMIRAASQRDRAAMQRLANAVRCRDGG